VNGDLALDGATLGTWGTLTVPGHVWRTLQCLGAWVEPVLVAEWASLVRGYGERMARPLWNLLPASPRVNQRLKRSRLPSAAALTAARARIMAWWDVKSVLDAEQVGDLLKACGDLGRFHPRLKQRCRRGIPGTGMHPSGRNGSFSFRAKNDGVIGMGQSAYVACKIVSTAVARRR
jgi:hypothetical protein